MTMTQARPPVYRPTRPAAVTQTSLQEAPLDEDQLRAVEEIHSRLLREVDVNLLMSWPREEARRAVESAGRQLLRQLRPQWYSSTAESVVRALLDEVLGLGPIERLVQDQGISEIMVNDFDEIYYERDGIIHESPARFRDREHVLHVIDRIATAVGRRIDESSPMVDARLADGSRVNAAIPPVVPRGPVLTIRKFRKDKMTLDQLVTNGSMTGNAAIFLGACVKFRRNMIVSGGTGSGKTTLLNALSAYIPENERIITIEDPIELKLQQKHVVAMEARPAGIEGQNAVTQRDIFRNALRMRPDRIVVGEVRASEAFDMIQAMNTGHDGSLTTIHANTPREALYRIENILLVSGFDLPVHVIREQIASAVHVVVQVSRLSDGTRRVTHITELMGIEGDVVRMQDIFKFVTTGLGPNGKVLGELKSTGLMPSFMEHFAALGIDLAPILRKPDVGAPRYN